MPLDLAAVSRIQAAYSSFADHQDADGLAALFSEDGALVIGGRDPIVGHEALKGLISNAPQGVHHVSVPHLQTDGTTRTAFTFFNKEPGRLASGYYTDTFTTAADGSLLFASRSINMLVVWPLPST